MKYALLIYNTIAIRDALTDDERKLFEIRVAEVLARPNVGPWVRLREVESATTVRHDEGRTFLTDGPFVDSKEYLAGLIVVEAANLDEALAVAAELQALRPGGAIEVRPARRGGAGWCSMTSFVRSGAGCWRHWSGCSAISSSPKRQPRRRS